MQLAYLAIAALASFVWRAVATPRSSLLEPGASLSMGNSRLTNLDAARGMAMILVCLSHFTQVYLGPGSGSPVGRLDDLYALGMIASPTFVVISGTVLGLLYVVRRESFGLLRLKLLDRALFLLTVAHILIACSRLVYQPHPLDALKMTFMTDTIGVCVIAGIFLITQTSRAVRCLLGVFCFAITWRLLYVWTPAATLLELTKEVLIGTASRRTLPYTVPILPWFGVYISATALGEYVGDFYRRADQRGVERALFLSGTLATGTSLILRAIGWFVSTRLATRPREGAFWSLFFSPWSKVPPGPTYVLFFGGLGLLLMWGVTAMSHRRHLQRGLSQLAMVGRSSLAVFTIQFYVYFTIIGPMHLHASALWPIAFGASLAAVFAFAYWWDRNGLNQLLTVGTGQAMRIAATLVRNRAQAAYQLARSTRPVVAPR
jgi:uncharacterized membrane protein